VEPLLHFAFDRSVLSPADRLQRVREAARAFREDFLAGGRVAFLRSVPLVHVPYPVRFGLSGAARGVAPYMHIVNRMLIVRFEGENGTRTLVVSPSDADANERTPFFQRLLARFDPLRGAARRILAPRVHSVPEALALAGVAPDEVDWMTYDHLHTQDLRPWLGVGNERGFFPRARLLIRRREWESALAPLGPQRDWYCPNGTSGIEPSRIVLLDGDVRLGDGVALVATPGHTEGNQSIVLATDDGILVSSENGVCADSWAPRASRIPGVARWAEERDVDVVLNSNTLERGLDQYISMIQEREIAGPAAADPRFPRVLPSSELEAYWLFPGLRPTFSLHHPAVGGAP
jgi:glyoxylase-like metal-dependent hydrolase (beta-lactamase superfamily II)